MNTEIKKQLSVLELSDLAAVIEAQEKEVSFVDLTYCLLYTSDAADE